MKIGVRGSKLALQYASRAAALISDPEIVTIKTEAEINPDTPILEMGGKGVFCKAIEQKLLDNEIDIAVHSLKEQTSDTSCFFSVWQVKVFITCFTKLIVPSCII